MDINYHYFAIKVLAEKAGFVEEDAQVIASYSQFVDDFDTYRFLYFKEVPEYARYLAAKVPTGWVFNPVTTGFNSYLDYSRLRSEKNQKKILIPFHFIPQNPLTVVPKDRRDYRVKPVTMAEGSLLQGMLLEASEKYQVQQNRENLIRIGTLLHIFADTYAHQRFSGFWNWENHAYLQDVVDDMDGKSIWKKYNPNQYYYAPSIGHSNVATAPDDSNVSFVMLQKISEHENYPYQDRYERDNVTEFLIASREILNYLRSCFNSDPISDSDWDAIESNLRTGFKTHDKEVAPLIEHWKSIFPDIPFYYSKKDMYTSNLSASVTQEGESGTAAGQDIMLAIMNNSESEESEPIMLAAEQEDFFLFNVIADRIRKTVDPTNIVDEELQEYSNELNLKDFTVADDNLPKL